MFRIINKKRSVVIGLVASLVVAAAAFAYFSSTGSGTGSATTGSSSAFTVSSTADTLGDLVPSNAVGSGVTDTISFTVKNPSAGKQNYNQTIVSIPSTWKPQADASKPSCSASDFSVGGEAVGSSHTDTENHGDLLAGQTVNNTVTLQMIDSGQNQDNCQGVTVPLTFSAS